jgi:hypothetical protein
MLKDQKIMLIRNDELKFYNFDHYFHKRSLFIESY